MALFVYWHTQKAEYNRCQSCLEPGEETVVKIIMIVLAVCLACSSFCAAQASPQKITNSDVIQMTKAGIADDTIISAIKRGPVSFDVSPQGLIALKTAGVSDKVLNEMIALGGAHDRAVQSKDDPAARTLFERVLDAIGTRDAMSGVHSMRWVDQESGFAQGKPVSYEREVIKIFPDHISSTLRTSSAKSTIVFTPDFCFSTNGTVTLTLPAAEIQTLRDQLPFDPLYIAKHRDDYSVTASKAESGNGDAVNLTITKGTASIVWKVDPKTNRILSYRVSGPSGMTEVSYSDWRLINGIFVAFKRHVVTPSSTIDATVSSYEMNPTISDQVFAPPPAASQGITLRILQAQSMPYVQESGGGVSTNCNIVGNANTSAYATSVGTSAYGNASTTSNQHMSCSSYDTTMRWPHVLNVMYAEASDGNSYIIACDAAWRWSKCKPLRVGDVFITRFTNKGVEVSAVNGKGKQENLTYRLLQSKVNH